MMDCLLIATQDAVRSACGYTGAQCGVQPDGMPPPSAGQVYAAVSGGDWANEDQDAVSLMERLGVVVTLSVRAALFPRDRVGLRAIAEARTGLYVRAEAIRAALHMNYALIAAANLAMGAVELTGGVGAQSANGFVEPLKFLRGGRAVRARADWWDADAEGEGGDPGFTLELTFGGALRVQHIESQG